MKFTTTFAVLFLSATSTVFAAPVDITTRDVWVPKILAPHAGAIWHVGKPEQVRWAVDRKPQNVTNPTGTVFLSHHGHLNTTHPLAKGFQLTDGHVSVTIPAGTPPGYAYHVVLMGDSGNASPRFTIRL